MQMREREACKTVLIAGSLHCGRRVARILLYAPALQRDVDADADVEIREIREFARADPMAV